MRFVVLFFAALWVPYSRAGEFDSYHWRLGFLAAQGHYQVTLKITYDYDAEGQFEPSVLALPNDDNMKLIRLNFKVDGDKVDAIDAYQSTYWSFGQQVRTFLPEREGQKVSADALYVIKNLFLIMPAPTNLPVPVNNLFVGFAPIHGFELTGSFIGKEYRFKSKKIAARVGDPTHLYGIWRRKVPASDERGYLFLMPKSFTFSFNDLRATQWDPAKTIPGGGSNLFGGTAGYNAGTPGAANQDTAAGHKGFSLDGDLKPYSANFYKGIPTRDWEFAMTWLQQERTYLPFGIQPGRRVQSRTLFLGSGDKKDQLLPWVEPPKVTRGDAILEADVTPSEAPDIDEAISTVDGVELFLEDFRSQMKLDRNLSRMIAYESREGMVSPALANRDFANAVFHRFGLKTVPALISIFPKERVAALPLGAFDRVITALKIGRNWFFVDVATPEWSLSGSMPFLKGHSVVIVDEGNIQMGGF